MSSAGSSRYRVFSTHRFRNAPFSKFWAASTLFGSAALIPLRRFQEYFLILVRNATQGKQLWKCFSSKLFFLDAKDIVAGCCLIYCMRCLERRMGTKKYVNFLALTTITVVSLELILYSAADFYLPDIRIPFFASGPYALLASCLVQFMSDVPVLSFASVFGISFSEKTIPGLLALMLFASSLESALSFIAGLVAGLMYKKNLLNVREWSPIIPNWISKRCDALTEPLQNVGEDRQGQILPFGATLEAQRQEAMDRFEQRMIYEQLRRQHLQDNQRGVGVGGGGVFLNAARRFFGVPPVQAGGGGGLAGAGAAAAAGNNVPEDKVRALTDMGFNNRQRVEQVLRSTGNDLNAAAHILLQQPD